MPPSVFTASPGASDKPSRAVESAASTDVSYAKRGPQSRLGASPTIDGPQLPTCYPPRTASPIDAAAWLRTSLALYGIAAPWLVAIWQRRSGRSVSYCADALDAILEWQASDDVVRKCLPEIAEAVLVIAAARGGL